MEYADMLEAESSDSGGCPNCGQHIDDGCECTEEEREGTEAQDAAIDAAVDRARDMEEDCQEENK